jgi:hypothetical protein
MDKTDDVPHTIVAAVFVDLTVNVYEVFDDNPDTNIGEVVPVLYEPEELVAL